MSNPQTDPNFGNGEVGGDRTWSPPVYGTTADGKPVTVSFSDSGHTGIANGHVSGASYYKKDSRGRNIGHDHYGPNGEIHADRGKYY